MYRKPASDFDPIGEIPTNIIYICFICPPPILTAFTMVEMPDDGFSTGRIYLPVETTSTGLRKTVRRKPILTTLRSTDAELDPSVICEM